MDIFGIIDVDKHMIDLLLVVSYMLLLLNIVVLIAFIKYHIRVVEQLTEQVEFYRGWALKSKGYKAEIDQVEIGIDIDEEEQ
jgi:hypothetical protein